MYSEARAALRNQNKTSVTPRNAPKEPIISMGTMKDKLTSIQSNKHLLEQKIGEYEHMLK